MRGGGKPIKIVIFDPPPPTTGPPAFRGALPGSFHTDLISSIDWWARGGRSKSQISRSPGSRFTDGSLFVGNRWGTTLVDLSVSPEISSKGRDQLSVELSAVKSAFGRAFRGQISFRSSFPWSIQGGWVGNRGNRRPAGNRGNHESCTPSPAPLAKTVRTLLRRA